MTLLYLAVALLSLAVTLMAAALLWMWSMVRMLNRVEEENRKLKALTAEPSTPPTPPLPNQLAIYRARRAVHAIPTSGRAS